MIITHSLPINQVLFFACQYPRNIFVANAERPAATYTYANNLYFPLLPFITFLYVKNVSEKNIFQHIFIIKTVLRKIRFLYFSQLRGLIRADSSLRADKKNLPQFAVLFLSHSAVLNMTDKSPFECLLLFVRRHSAI